MESPSALLVLADRAESLRGMTGARDYRNEPGGEGSLAACFPSLLSFLNSPHSAETVSEPHEFCNHGTVQRRLGSYSHEGPEVSGLATTVMNFNSVGRALLTTAQACLQESLRPR
jgi:hypothetical protein